MKTIFIVGTKYIFVILVLEMLELKSPNNLKTLENWKWKPKIGNENWKQKSNLECDTKWTQGSLYLTGKGLCCYLSGEGSCCKLTFNLPVQPGLYDICSSPSNSTNFLGWCIKWFIRSIHTLIFLGYISPVYSAPHILSFNDMGQWHPCIHDIHKTCGKIEPQIATKKENTKLLVFL